jgi:putative transposase
MSSSKRTTLLTNVPLESWPAIDVSVLTDEDAQSVEKRISALTLYAQGTPHRSINQETGITRQEINRLLRRCIALSEDGQVEGFRALLPGKRIAPYVRSAPVKHEKGSGSAGCAGALSQLFDRFPELRHFIDL